MGDPEDTAPTGLDAFNALDGPRAASALREVCAADAWIAAVRDGRPYPGSTDVYAASDTATAALTDPGLDQAMAAHPPIGRPTPGDPASAREQRGMAGAPEHLRARMLELNLAYQERFGHVFLICATGLSAADMLTALTARLGNTPEREREAVRVELGRINRLRLARLLGDDTPTAEEAPK
ncbi:2-oxo-4-hydroxy-4-carboxy-5-ureidoimidazoline decarboxylase [Streptomyces sp. NPDC050560]|uniref:2-oxo-4-hydroxy-4-carboxy-5-ureidoimidazoline decarboxylase n=1 Tax=Streptomyces sp. NPDC050560 TaxID=3365630 RepID=UPI0037B8BA4D